MATVPTHASSSSPIACLKAYLARHLPPPPLEASIPPFPRPSLNQSCAVSFSAPRTRLQEAVAARRQQKLSERVLTWIDMQQVRYVVGEAAMLLPAEHNVATAVAMKLGHAEEDATVPPACLDELELMLATLNQPMLKFTQFAAMRPQLPAAAASYCTADVFLQLQPHDAHGRIHGLAWLAVVEQASAQIAALALLQRADVADCGWLSEAQVTDMVKTWVDQVPWVHGIDPAFKEYYVRIATRLLWLPLVPYRTGKLYIDKASKSNVVQSMVPLLCRAYHDAPEYAENPLSMDRIQRLHRQYVQLDTDKNGLLSAEEVLHYGQKKAFVGPDQRPTHALTRRFVQRVFDELVTFDGDDYNSFLDLNLYLHDHTSKHALQFFWRVLDVHQCGTLDAAAVDYFLADISHAVATATGQPLDIPVLRSELFDMIHPKDPRALTFDDVWSSGRGHSFVRIVSDYEAYLHYERTNAT
ncbi:hypothetical protein, variant 1 [Aphanomyces invadans]|uniref:Uncharacterized protein n=1 Tax=Aphanomyces invadans TaxID=157072 RepID=A0A024TF58_9STRA|nr:hypothetical protein, variant 1 [Aphanomyces invadans]ETV92795.1 hypothetical protein, variant 1 [Aphanomyces invadans]|eukprot:XP_008878565.1 hypothetical protein, variant 1 [Aphanomyces invadans]